LAGIIITNKTNNKNKKKKRKKEKKNQNVTPHPLTTMTTTSLHPSVPSTSICIRISFSAEILNSGFFFFFFLPYIKDEEPVRFEISNGLLKTERNLERKTKTKRRR